MTLVKKILSKVRSLRLQNYRKKNEGVFIHAPFSSTIFMELLENVSNTKKYKLLSFNQTLSCTHPNFHFRSDLDTQKCLENFHIIANLLINKNVPGSFFVRVDEMDYKSKDAYEFVKNFMSELQIGLHSSCYIHDDFVSVLREEIDKFAQIFGFSPKYLTLHGLGKYRYETRLALTDLLSSNYKDFGFEFTDCIPQQRHYDYVIQDCHLLNGERFLKKDIEILPPPIKGMAYLVLTHPCYWT